MKCLHAQTSLLFAEVLLLSVTIVGCSSRGPVPGASSAGELPPAKSMALQKYHVELGGAVSVDYQIERKISSVNQKSCYAFITGTLNNGSPQTLQRRETVLDFNVITSGRQVFRDLTFPIKDVPPGGRVQLEMIDSPVHKDGCVEYEHIDISLRKVIAN
jgi:hypothetical protein